MTDMYNYHSLLNVYYFVSPFNSLCHPLLEQPVVLRYVALAKHSLDDGPRASNDSTSPVLKHCSSIDDDTVSFSKNRRHLTLFLLIDRDGVSSPKL